MSRCSHRKGILLAIEPTDPPGSIALGREGRILEFRSLSPGGQLSEDFLPLLSEMFHEAQLDLSDVEGVVLCAGPGSFTGIRVGYRWDGADFGRVSEYISISPENLIYKVISQKCIVFGPGYARYRDIFNRNGVGPYPGEQELNGVLNAETLLRYFFRRDDIAGVDPVDARPIYVRPSEAELKFGRRKL
jgi:tRNA A37 threonylcarbamoyladenosine modification protein TsaB